MGNKIKGYCDVRKDTGFGREEMGRMPKPKLAQQLVYLGYCSATVTDLSQHNRLAIRRGLHLLGLISTIMVP